MHSLTFATVFNQCFGMKKKRFTTTLRRRLTHPQLRIRYHWSRHFLKMIQTGTPHFRYAPPCLSSFGRDLLLRQARLNHLAAMQRLRLVQRAVLRWLFRPPKGPMFLRQLQEWSSLLTTTPHAG